MAATKGPQRRFYVNYTDASFPCVLQSRRDEMGPSSWKEGKSFAKAKRELVTELRRRKDRAIEHWKEARKLTKENVIEQANG